MGELSASCSKYGHLSGQISGKGHLSGRISPVDTLSGTISEAGVGDTYYPPYKGRYFVAPEVSHEQILETKDTFLQENIVVSEIPYSEVSNVLNGVTVYIGKDV